MSIYISHQNHPSGKNRKESQILLCLMPFWSPLNPPLGISTLKSYLGQEGFSVTTYDFNTEDELWETVDKYFQIIRQAVPEDRQSNFHMISFDVLSNHLAAFLKKNNSDSYYELLRILVSKNYLVEIPGQVAEALDKVVSEFYAHLKSAVIRLVTRLKPGILGISVFSTSLGPSLYAFRTIRDKFPEVETVMGGGIFADHLAPGSPNFSRFMNDTESYIDTVIIGEGERLFHYYLEGRLEPGKKAYGLADINGENLDVHQAAVADFSGLKLEGYSQMVNYASRSCPFQCGFCSETVQWGRYRMKSGEQVVSEIAEMIEKYGGKLFMFGDSLMNPIAGELSREIIARKMEFFWDGYFRTDPMTCNPEDTDLWRKAGLYRVRLGIESGSQNVLDLMNKKITVNQIKGALSTLANSGIKTTTYWVIGYPGETEEDFNETIQLLEEMKNDIYEADWHPFYFYPQGQVKSSKWNLEYGIEPLYPPEYDQVLLLQTWTLDTSPGRREILDRLNRFGQACKRLGIPNPYSLDEIYQADKRWKQLHPACGPTILELHNYNFVK